MIIFEHPTNSVDYPNKKAKYNTPTLPEEIILTIFNFSTFNDMKSLLCTSHYWNDKEIFELYPNIKKYHLNSDNFEVPFQLSRLQIIEKVQNIYTIAHRLDCISALFISDGWDINLLNNATGRVDEAIEIIKQTDCFNKLKNQIVLLTHGFCIDDKQMDEHQKDEFLQERGWYESKIHSSLTLFSLMRFEKEVDIPKRIICKAINLNKYYYYSFAIRDGNFIFCPEYMEDYLPMMAETLI
ncbi:MAG: hypothetical protein LW832_03725 [Parachlamydia sp.]|jgi:hypothetical protein|nr:hypothetical protein [Parachlamydia sp.]